MRNLTAIALAGLLTACGGNGNSTPDVSDPLGPQGINPALLSAKAPAVDKAARDDAARASQRLGVELFSLLAETNSDDNLVVSPVSVAIAMSMVLAGAVDEAAEELAGALQLSDAGKAHEGMSGLMWALRARDGGDGVSLSLANRSFVQRDYPVEQDYIRALAHWYGDAMATADFAGQPEAERERINDWVSQQTRELIPELMPDGSIDGLTRLVLVNALYLLADWKEAFDADDTRDESFHLRDGGEVQVPMMHARRQLPIVHGDGYGAFELPYAGDKLALLVVVPEDWNTFEAALDNALLDEIIGGLREREAEIGLPRLETRTQAALVPALRALGASRIFEPGAGALLGIADDPDLHVSAVQHETFLRMDEKGTEAAAATGVVVGVTSLPPPKPRIIADRPYLLVLRDRDTGAVLFFGRILDPR